MIGFENAGNSPLLAIAGPTAVGKSELALALCDYFEAGNGDWQGAEIISVDSAQVYRGMDIGSAKPDSLTRGRVPHHLIDILDPSEPYSAARFVADARTAIASIRARGKMPILVGGTLLYFRALLDGLSALPAADSGLRVQLQAEAANNGAIAQHARLTVLDPVTAARLHPNDAQRVQRALEIHALTGVTASDWHARPKGAGPKTERVVRLALHLPDRASLDRRISTRFRQMLDNGFVEEVESLRARGDLHLGMPSMRAVGYRQIWRYLDGDYGREEAERLGVIATRQLAKRQMTWLRGDGSWLLLDAAEPFCITRVLNSVNASPVFQT